MKVEVVATIAAAPAYIWHAMIRPQELEHWLATEAQFDARVGRPYRLVLPFAEPVTATGRVIAWVPEVRLSYSMTGTPWGVDTTVTFFLASQEGGQTKLTVFHDGFKKLPNKRRSEVMADVEAFWVKAFERLQSHMGLPVSAPQVAVAAV